MGQIEIVKAAINSIKKALAELKKIPAGAPGQKNRRTFEANLVEKQELLKKLKSIDTQATLEAAGIPVRGGKIRVADVREILAGTMDSDEQKDFANFCKKATDDQLQNIAEDELGRTASRADSDYHFQCLDIAVKEMERRGMHVNEAYSCDEAMAAGDDSLFPEQQFIDMSIMADDAESKMAELWEKINSDHANLLSAGKPSWKLTSTKSLLDKIKKVQQSIQQIREDIGEIGDLENAEATEGVAKSALPERVVFTTPDKQYRIVEMVDTDYDLDNLKGDVFNPKHIDEMHQPGMTPERLADEEKDFEAEVDREGVYGYELQHREPSGDYEHVDSCWGFVGQYDKSSKKYNHYIVDEMKSAIKDEPQEAHSGRISEMREEFKQGGKKPAAPIKKMGLENTKDHKQKYVEMHALAAIEIPKDFPVQPVKPGQKAKDPVTCGDCGLTWDDAITTSMTPAPSARCPFEAFHAEATAAVQIPQVDGDSESVNPDEIAEIGSTCSNPNEADEDGEKSWIELKGGNEYIYSPLSAKEVKKLVQGAFDSSGYHPEDEMMHHLIQAYICKKFDKMDWYNKHIDLALDHAANDPKLNYSRKNLEEMVDEGKELFHDMDEDEITERPTQFESSQFDDQVGQEAHAATEAKCEYILGLSDDEETGLGDGAYDKDIATKECKMAVKDMIKGKAKEIKIRYVKEDGREEGNVLHVFELKGPANLIKKIEEMQ